MRTPFENSICTIGLDFGESLKDNVGDVDVFQKSSEGEAAQSCANNNNRRWWINHVAFFDCISACTVVRVRESTRVFLDVLVEPGTRVRYGDRGGVGVDSREKGGEAECVSYACPVLLHTEKIEQSDDLEGVGESKKKHQSNGERRRRE
jgi:hypothetical protein